MLFNEQPSSSCIITKKSDCLMNSPHHEVLLLMIKVMLFNEQPSS